MIELDYNQLYGNIAALSFLPDRASCSESLRYFSLLFGETGLDNEVHFNFLYCFQQYKEVVQSVSIMWVVFLCVS